MNTLNTLNSLRTDIKNLKAAMVPNRDKVEAFKALQAAVATLAQQELTLSVLESKLAEADKREAMRQNAISRITIVKVTSSEERPGPATRRTVEFQERCHGLYGEELRPGRLALDGMSQELSWAVMADPKRHLPQDILALHADPLEAMHLHCRYVRRGWAD